MRVRIKGQCRGEGKTYLRICASVEEGHTLVATSKACGGEQLPCKIIPLETVFSKVYKEYVLVVYTAKNTQTVTFGEVGSGGELVQECKKFISPFFSKWASRFNGVFNKELCLKIRNCDSKGLDRQSVVSIEGCLYIDGKWVLRGSFFARCNDLSCVSIDLYDSAGRKSCVAPVILSISPARYDDPLGSALREIRFSIELPTDQGMNGNYCILAGVEGDSGSWCFEALERDVLEGLEKSYRIAHQNAWDDPSYSAWVGKRLLTKCRADAQRKTSFSYEPLFSVVVPLFRTPLSFFEEMVRSVISQTYVSWELILVNASPEDKELASLVQLYADRDERIKTVTLDCNKGITENTNVGIRLCSGDFICFFDHDDVLEPDILFEYAKALNRFDDIDLLYCDEDKLYPDGRYANPMLKPDFSIDLLRDNNYICHMLAVRRDLHAQLESATGNLDGAQDHSLALQVAEKSRRIYHVPKILYHWRISENSTAGNADSKPYATEAGIRAVQLHLEREGINARVECSHGRAFRYKVDYSFSGEPSVSLVVPTRGGNVLLETLRSIVSVTQYKNYEVILACEDRHEETVERLVADNKLSLHGAPVSLAVYEGPFNYANAINAGVSVARGEYYAFLHDDVCPVSPSWIEGLLQHITRTDVGVVGPMICDYDGAVQQAGLFIVDGEAVGVSPGLDSEMPGYVFRPLSTQNLSAVSAICMMTSKNVFEREHGFDAIFERVYSEVDYCFRVRSSGDLVVYTPEVRIKHRSSMGRGRPRDLDSMSSFYLEKAAFLARWASLLAAGDPYFNPNFSHIPSEACLFKLDLAKPVEL